MSDLVDVEQELDALYVGPVEGFLEARKALVAKLKKLGKRDTAARVGAAPKPTAPAWAVNKLYRIAPEGFASLLELGARLREAQVEALASNAKAGAVVELQKEVRAAAKELAGKAKALLEEAKLSATPATLEKVSTSLERIATTGTWGDSAPGRLIRELEAAGIDAMTDLLAAALSGGAAPAPPPPPRPAPAAVAPLAAPPVDTEAERAAKERRGRAERRVGEAKAELEQARREERLRLDEREAAKKAAEAARAARTEAELQVIRAREAIEAARRALEGAEAEVARLGGAVRLADERVSTAAGSLERATARLRAAEAGTAEAERELEALR